jgi:hypothetical protein
MKTSLFLATLVVVGTGAIGAGATFAPQPYQGSDTLFDITNGAMVGLGIAGVGKDYTGGGSGAGENAMTAAAPIQVTAPMSKMMTNQTCKVVGGAALYSHASGVAIGLDAVDVYSAISAGGTVACNGAAGAGGDNTGAGLAYTTGGYNNWTDILALLYGGMNKGASLCVGGTAAGAACNPQTQPQSGTACVTGGGTCTPLVDCNSTARQNLVAHWTNLFQNGCSNPLSVCNGASLPIGAATTSIGGQLWHAFRRDDNSGTSDAFASLIGLGQLTDVNGKKTISANVSSAGNWGYGASPYCNVINVDNTAPNLNCALGTNKQFVGPGGILDTVANDGVHRRPPVNAWGDVNDPQVTLGAAALPTSYQDNDPIRRPCIGRKTFVGNTSNPAEEVCNTDGNLGVVIPVPAVDFIPRQYPTGGIGGAARTAYNTQLCNGVVNSSEFPVYKCTQRSAQPSFYNLCPDGAPNNGGNCYFPQQQGAQTTTLCENNPGHWASLNTAQDGRIYNEYVTDGAGAYTTFTIGGAFLGSPNGTGVPAAQTLTFAGAFARIHSQLPMFDPSVLNCNVNADCPATSPVCFNGSGVAGPPFLGSCVPNVCQQGDATDQIGCLAQADPCSVGFAADGAKTWGARAVPAVASNNDALRVNQIYPTTTTVQNGSYDLWRKVYFNASGGFDQAALANTDQLALGQYESNPGSITGLLGTYGFFGFGHSPNATTFPGNPNAGNAPFCEDFNEWLIGTSSANTCTGTVTNSNACNFNSSAQQPAANSVIPAANLANFSPIPSDPSLLMGAPPVGAAGNPTISTVCGNGVKEAFEDCDNGTPGAPGVVSGGNGSAGNLCSITCRTIFP